MPLREAVKWKRRQQFLGKAISKRTCEFAVFGLLLSLVLFSGIAQAEVRILTDKGATPEDVALAEVIRTAISQSRAAVSRVDVRVTIGAPAFRRALEEPDHSPLIASYLTSAEFEAALQGKERPPNVTAVFSNPDPLDQLALARALLGSASIGVFDSPAVHSLVARLSRERVRAIAAARGRGVDSLLRATDALDVIIVLPDSGVLNRANINHVVRSLYQQRTVLIGYSATLTRVGALASVYVRPDAIAREVSDVIDGFASVGALSAPRFVRDVDVNLNSQLARSLNIALPDRTTALDFIRSQQPVGVQPP